MKYIYVLIINNKKDMTLISRSYYEYPHILILVVIILKKKNWTVYT